jgi:hypothetical protein
MEFQEFLDQLYRKYGFIIGPKQALLYFDAQKAEQDDFKMNEKRLEDRLASLGVNPFFRTPEGAFSHVEVF